MNALDTLSRGMSIASASRCTKEMRSDVVLVGLTINITTPCTISFLLQLVEGLSNGRTQ